MARPDAALPPCAGRASHTAMKFPKPLPVNRLLKLVRRIGPERFLQAAKTSASARMDRDRKLHARAVDARHDARSSHPDQASCRPSDNGETLVIQRQHLKFEDPQPKGPTSRLPILDS